MNTAARKIYLAVVMVTLLIAAGTVGYVAIERMPFLDALYMTVITITIVGYEEVKPLDSAGRVFTIILILTGVGSALYVFSAITETVVGGQLRDILERSAMNRKIHQLENHVILCGYGRFGRIVAEELQRNGKRPVIIEQDPKKEPELIRAEALYIIGSALDEGVLDQAGIASATDIVIATASDPDNVYISLSARDKNAHVRIHARAESDLGMKHLNLAGVNHAISSYQWSALRIANAIARPSVVDFLGLVLPGRGDEEISIEEVTIPSGSHISGKMIAEVERENDRVRVVALKRGAEPISLIPAPETVIAPGDLLIAIGARVSLKNLAVIIER
jgi:voltage-gated potassium channel